MSKERFVVFAEYSVPRWTTYEVEADSATEAEAIVRALIENNTIDWSLAEWDFDSSTPETVWAGEDGTPIHHSLVEQVLTGEHPHAC